MKKNEKLLDAIGQIDDRLVEEAARAGAPAGAKKRRKKKKVTMYRLQGALAACAMLMVCAGIASLVQRNGTLYQNSGSAEIMEEAAMDTAGAEGAAAPAENDESSMLSADSGGMAEGKESAKTAAEDNAGAQTTAKEEAGDGAAQEPTQLSDERMEAEAQQEVGKESAQEHVEALRDDKSLEEAKRSEEAGQQADKNGVGGYIVESGAQAAAFVITNDGERAIILKEAYALERLEENAWQTVEPVAEVCWKEEGILLEAGESHGMTSSLEKVYGELTPGQYRLVRYYQLAAGKEPEGMEEYPLYLEFSVAP